MRRSLKVCERLLAKRDLGFDDLERVVISGGATRNPYFARLLTEQGGGLGRRVASSVDPFTVVVQGAALYAGGEPVERAAPPVFVGGREVASELEAEVVEETPVAEPVVTEEVAAEEPAAAVEEVEAPAEEVAVEPAAEAEEAPVAEEAPEEAAALQKLPEVEAPLLAEPVSSSLPTSLNPAAAVEEVEAPAEEVAVEPAAEAEGGASR